MRFSKRSSHVFLGLFLFVAARGFGAGVLDVESSRDWFWTERDVVRILTGVSSIVPLAAPANDHFADAVVIEGASGQATGSNVEATFESGEPVHAGLGAGASVWWRWAAPASGRWSFDTAGSDFDTVLGVYTGSSVSNLDRVAANDDGGPGGTSKVIFTATEGTTYSIVVDGYYFAFSVGNIVLNWAPAPPPPPNDAFADAIALEGLFGQTTGTNDGALKEPGEPDHAGVEGGASVWWKWTAPGSGFLMLNTRGSMNLSGYQFDTVLAVYIGAQVDNLTAIAANDDEDRNANIYTSLVSFPVQPGVEYRIAVDGYGRELGNIILNWMFTPQAPAEIRGSLWEDVDGDGHWDEGEPALAGWTVFLDQNGNGELDPDEIFTVTDANGQYVFANLEPGSYLVAEVLQEGWRQTYPARRQPAPSREAVRAAVAGVTTTAAKDPVYRHEEFVLRQEGAIYPGTAQSGPLINLSAFRNDPRFADIDGSGYTIAILDTGIDLTHPFFGPDADGDGVADRILFHYDFADQDANANDPDGHGSNVSGIAASQDTARPGMAPGAGIVALKVFSNSGEGNFAIVEQALQWVVQNAEAYNIVAVNMSLGDGRNHSVPTLRYGIDDELAALAMLNVIVTCSAGNDFARFSSVPGVSYPAADPNALAVGAVFDANLGTVSYSGGSTAYTTDADRITPFSQRHETLLSIFAPGAAISNASARGGVATFHGTSQAAPHIAGIAALAQQLADQILGRRLTPAEFADLLRSTGTVIHDGDDEDDNVDNTFLNYPRVNVLALGLAILSLSGNGAHAVTVASGQVAEGVNFGNQSPVIDELVTYFYLSALNREPEPGAVSAWRDGYFHHALNQDLNVTLITKEMGRIFFLSEEYASRQQTREAFIRDCYTVFLFREPSEWEMSDWMSGIWEPGQVVTIFADSQEHADLMETLFPRRSGIPSRNFVTMIYSGFLDRLVESGGLFYWEGRMLAAADKRQEAAEMIRQVLQSAEFVSRGHNSAQTVSRLYRGCFGRFPAEHEIAYWAGELDSGRRTLDGLVSAFTGSTEFGAILGEYFETW